jgi:hypothetical protein
MVRTALDAVVAPAEAGGTAMVVIGCAAALQRTWLTPLSLILQLGDTVTETVTVDLRLSAIAFSWVKSETQTRVVPKASERLIFSMVIFYLQYYFQTTAIGTVARLMRGGGKDFVAASSDPTFAVQIFLSALMPKIRRLSEHP